MSNYIYERQLTVQNGKALVVPGGALPTCFAIGSPPAGLLKKLIVQQAPGSTPVPFAVNLFNAPTCNDGSVSSDVGVADRNLARILPEHTATAGQPVQVFSEQGYAYRNQVGTFAVPDRNVYLEIVPEGAVTDTEWEVAIALIPSQVF